MANTASNIAVVILAAGASNRMGSPKQLLKWGSETLIIHAIQKAINLSTKEVIVILGANYEKIKEHIDNFPVTILNNPNWNLGLGNSIACASKYLSTQNNDLDGVMITLVDQPFITKEFLNKLIANFSPGKNQIIATAYENNYGVPVLFDKSYFKKLIALNDDFGAKQVLKENESSIKALIPPVKNVDLDYKEDYESYYKTNFNK